MDVVLAKESQARPQGLALFPCGHLCQAGQVGPKGTLEPGMLADVVLLDRSLVGIDEEDIRNVTVNMTIVDGKIAYEK